MNPVAANAFRLQEENCGFQAALRESAIKYLEERNVFCVQSVPALEEDLISHFDGTKTLATLQKSLPRSCFYMVYWDQRAKGYKTKTERGIYLRIDDGAGTVSAKFAAAEEALGGRIVLYPQVLCVTIPGFGKALPKFTPVAGVEYTFMKENTTNPKTAMYLCPNPRRDVSEPMNNYSQLSLEIAMKVCTVRATSDTAKLPDFVTCANRHGLKLVLDEAEIPLLTWKTALPLVIAAFDSLANSGTDFKAIDFGEKKDERMACALLRTAAAKPKSEKGFRTLLKEWRFAKADVDLMCQLWAEATGAAEDGGEAL